MEKQAEFLKQLNWKIESAEKSLQSSRDELRKNIDVVSVAINFGLAKYAEDITKYTILLESLYGQRDIFISIFEDAQ